MKNKIIVFMLMLILMTTSVLGYFTNIQVIYSNSSTAGNNIYYDSLSSEIVLLETSTNRIFYYVSTNGVLNTSRTFYAGNNYGYFTIGNRNYYSRFNSGASGYVSSVNSTYLNNSINFVIPVSSDSPAFMGLSRIGNYIYDFRGSSSARLNVWNVSNNTRIFNDNSLPDLSSTDCIVGDSDKLSIYGYDYDNNYLYLYCPNTSDLVYIKEDYYTTKDVFNNVELDETILFNIATPQTYTLQQAHQTNYKFVKVNDKIYMKNTSNTSQIIRMDNVDIYAGLICNNGNTICYQENSVCLPNNEFYTGVNSSNYLCEKVSLLGDDVYCDVDNVSYCAGGCINAEYTNAYNVDYTKGTCYNSTTCTNDCVVEGLTYSDSSTSYKICGFYDSDTCLDWSSSIPCADGEYSVNGFCETLNTSGVTYYNLDSFSFNPNIEIASSYNYNSEPKQANYNSENTFNIIGLDYQFNPTTAYITQVCEYNTSTIYTDSVTKNINSTSTFIINGFDNGQINLKVLPKENGSVLIQGTDLTDNLIFEYNLSNNISHGICLYDNDSLLGCEAVDYDDINFIDFTIQLIRPANTQIHSTKTIINKISGGYQDIYTGFLNPVTSPVNTFGKLKITSDNASLRYINVFNEQQIFKPYKNTSWTQISGGEIIYQHSCTYESVGCRIVKSYYKEDLSEGNWNNKEWKICINQLGDVKISESNNSLFNNLTDKEKIIMALLITFVITILIFIFAILENDDGTKRVIMWIGAFCFVASIIVFAVIGWLPSWIIIISALVASAIVGILFLKKSQGD